MKTDDLLRELICEVRGLGEKISGLEEKVGRLEEKVGGLEEKVGGLEEKVGRLEAEVIELKESHGEKLSRLRDSIVLLEHDQGKKLATLFDAVKTNEDVFKDVRERVEPIEYKHNYYDFQISWLMEEVKTMKAVLRELKGGSLFAPMEELN